MYSKLFLAASALPVALVQAATFTVGQDFQIVLNSIVDVSKPLVPDVPVYDVDVFDTSKATISALKAKGKTVICYFSGGTAENWRSDYSQFDQNKDLGNALADWDGENWVNINNANMRAIMKNRIQLAASKGCDAIDPDNTDVNSNDNGMGITKAQAINYFQFLASTAATLGLKIGLKNSIEWLPDVSSIISFAVNESCDEYNECNAYDSFLASGKPVFHIEYPANAPTKVTAKEKTTYCSDASKSVRMSTVMKSQNLNGWVMYCDGSSYTTSTKEQDDLKDDTTTSTTSTTIKPTSSTTMKTTTSAAKTTAAPATPTPTATVPKGGRCGGRGYKGSTKCRVSRSLSLVPHLTRNILPDQNFVKFGK